MKTSNGSKVISNPKIKSVIRNARKGNLDNLMRFAQKELLLGELSVRTVNGNPLVSHDDLIFAGLGLGYASSKHGKRKRDSGRLFLGHSIDAERVYNDVYLSYFDHGKQKNWPATTYNAIDTGTPLCHDLIEDEDVTREDIVESLTTLVLNSAIQKKKYYTDQVIPRIANNVVELTRDYSYLKLWNKVATEWTRKLDCYKLVDKISNVNELEKLESEFSRFINTKIKDPIKSAEWINYPSRRLLNVLSTFSHKGVEWFQDLMHDLEIKNRLYPNPKTLHEIFKSFIRVILDNV